MDDISEILTKSIAKVDKDIYKSKLDANHSGSTCCLTLIKDEIIDEKLVQELYIANTGDSRAILCRFNETFPDESVESIPVLYEVSMV